MTTEITEKQADYLTHIWRYATANLNTGDPTAEQLTRLAELAQARRAAWSAINQQAPSSTGNDWPGFTLAYSRWWNYYRAIYHGATPEPDKIDAESLEWVNRFNKKK